MGWFDDLIKERKQKSQHIVESSFNDVFKYVFGKDKIKESPLKLSLEAIFKYYHIYNIEAPENDSYLAQELNRLLGKRNILTKYITFDENWQKENTEPILAFTKNSHTPVALFPKGNDSYYFKSNKGKKVIVTPEIVEKLESKAISFYRPLPHGKATFKDYHKYIFSNLKIGDVILIAALIALVTVATMIEPYLTRILMGEVVTDKNYALFLSTALYLVGAGFAVVLIKAVQAIINARINIKVEKAAHSSIMMHLLTLPTSFFKKYNTGELNSRINTVSALCNLIVTGVLIGGLSSLLSLLYLVQIGTFSIRLVLPTFLIVFVNVASTIFVSIIQRQVARKQTRLVAKENGVSYDLIKGIQKIRLTGSEKRAFAKWSSYYAKAARIQYNPPLIIKLAPLINILITALGSVLIYYIVAVNDLDTGTYVAFATTYGMLSGALLALNRILSNAARIRPLMEMVAPILEEKGEDVGDKKVIDQLKGSITLDHVSFKYNEDSPLVVDDLSLNIKEGEYVAIVGKTGCGKSTIVRLLLGFEKPTSGSIYYDDMNIEDVDLPSLRKKIGSVTQNGSLFHADIFHNIIISAPELNESDAWEAARLANIDKDIYAMPMRMNTVISEGQGSISGGQKQRIMIARAIVHKPKILIFDEATSALDNECQKGVTESIGKLNCTRIVIAHRLSTIKDCDRILYIENGHIVEEGNYEELLNLNGKFKELIERQKI